MAIDKNSGFTIIETVLFLGVTGALTVGVLIGSGVSINQQRYRDSVNSLKSYIQQQYTEVNNVVNSRSGSEACTESVIDESPGASPQPRGTSECVIIGRVIKIDNSGTQISSTNVMGYRLPNALEAANDSDEITKNYKLTVSTIETDNTEVAWSMRVVKEKTQIPMGFTLLILRSPISGSTMTYSSEGNVTDLKSLINVASSNKVHNLCVDSPAGTFLGSRMAVQVGPYATNQGAIQIPLESMAVCD